MVALRRTLLVALLACLHALGGWGVASTPAAGIGMSDGRPVLFDSEDLHEINFQYVRLVLPWDAARNKGDWDTWLKRATDQRWPVLIAPTGNGAAPSPADYEAALRTLLDRYPAIDSVEGWNEPNHGIQPTAGKPALAASYFEAARRACGTRCTAVAGNLLDVPSMTSYLAAYRAALTTEPAVWGIHNYYDATYFQHSGIDAVLAVAKGPVWITETGGLVSFQPGGPGTGLLPDEHRAADSLRWLFSLTRSEPRLARMYLYGMWQQPWNAFDSALVRVDNSERESMDVVRAEIGPRPRPPSSAPGPGGPPTNGGSSGATAAAGETGAAGETSASGATPGLTTATPILRLVGKRISVDPRTGRASLTIRCALAECRGDIKVRVGTWAYKRGLRLTADQTKTLRVRLGPSAVRRIGRRPSRGATASVCRATTCSTLPIVLQ